VRILIADRRADVRSAVGLFLQARKELEAVGEACDSQELLEQVEATRPDVVLLDWELLGEPVPELLSTLRGLAPSLKVIVLGSGPEHEQEAVAAGADYFVDKGDSPRRLLTAIQVIEIESRYA
jgi:DNA-binding NarL/FixJ family response regulator